MIVFPNAKINIGLHIVSKRKDGYHNLETIYYPAKLADALELAEAEKTELSFSGIPIDGKPEDNLVYKAWQILQKDFDIPPVRFHLHKVVPLGAGLGGGSSDAAFALKMLNDYFSLKLDENKLQAYATKIGADCAFFIKNKPVLARGIGDDFSPVELDLSAYEIIILKPETTVSTPEAYRHVIPRHPEFNLNEIASLPVERWKDNVINDFEKSVFPQFPEIKKLKDFLYKQGALYAAMSGSGSAVYGIFRHLPVNIENLLPPGVSIYR